MGTSLVNLDHRFVKAAVQALVFAVVLGGIPFVAMQYYDLDNIGAEMAKESKATKLRALTADAEAGKAQAQVDLAFLLLSQEGPDRDVASAYRWLLIAKRQANEASAKEIDAYLRQLEADLGPEATAREKAAALAWQPPGAASGS